MGTSIRNPGQSEIDGLSQLHDYWNVDGCNYGGNDRKFPLWRFENIDPRRDHDLHRIQRHGRRHHRIQIHDQYDGYIHGHRHERWDDIQCDRSLYGIVNAQSDAALY